MRYREASVHGRFQPLHNGHMEYLLEAKRRCDYLWVGITWPVISEANDRGVTERERPENNPLDYAERVQMLSEALVDAGIPRSDFGFTPFPIERPDTLLQYLSVTIPCLTTICEEWNRVKIRLLRDLGYPVEVLYERSIKKITATFIRDNIALGGTEWKGLVPPTTLRLLEEWGIRERLNRLRSRI